MAKMFDRVSHSLMVLRRGRLTEADNGSGSPQEPEWSNQEINGAFEERRLITFDRMTDELKDPADDEQRQSPAPTEEDKRQRDDDHRNADAVRQPVQRVLMLGFVAG